MDSDSPFNLQSYADHRKRVRSIMIDEGMVLGGGSSMDAQGFSQSGGGVGAGIAMSTGVSFPQFLKDGWEWVFGKGSYSEDVDDNSKERADQLMDIACDKAFNSDWKMLRNILRDFDRDFSLFLLDGSFNLDSKDGATGDKAYNDTDTTVKVFSEEYLNSLRSKEHFIQIATNFYLSTAAVIDLCRSPAFFALSHESGTRLLFFLSRRADVHKDKDPLFWAWVQKAETDRNIRDINTRTMFFDVLSLVRRGVCRMRTLFLLGENLKDQARCQKLQEFLSMGYNTWLNYMLGEHALGSDGKNLTTAEIDDVVANYMNVDACIQGMVRSVDQVNVKEMHAEHKSLYPIQLDLFYANLVHGAAVRIPLSEIWCPNNEIEHSDADSERFFKVMWNSLEEVIRSSISGQVSFLTTQQSSSAGGRASGASNALSINASEFMDKLARSVKRIKDTKRIMKEIWEASKDYRVSDRVHMVEMQVLQRLKADGVFPYVNAVDGVDTLGLNPQGDRKRVSNTQACFYMRRNEQLRYAFASAVGKRFYTQRMGSTAAKSSIIDHHRSVNWSEVEYANLLGVVRANEGMLANDLGANSVLKDESKKHLVADYCGMLVPSPSVDLAVLQKKPRWSS
jgi:hypothetical protein